MKYPNYFNDDVRKTITGKVQHLMDENNETTKVLANAININHNTLKGKQAPNGNTPYHISELLAICNHYNCELDYLIGVQDEKTKAVTDACAVTGLSAEAIEKLQGDTMISTLTDFILRSDDYSEISHFFEVAAERNAVLSVCRNSEIYKLFKTQYRKHADYPFNAFESNSYAIDSMVHHFVVAIADYSNKKDVDDLYNVLIDAAIHGIMDMPTRLSFSMSGTVSMLYKIDFNEKVPNNSAANEIEKIKKKISYEDYMRNIKLCELLSSVYIIEDKMSMLKWEISERFNDIIIRFIKRKDENK